MAFMSAYYSGMKINVLDITPNYAGTTTAIVNGISSISGIISPYLIGLLTPNVSIFTKLIIARISIVLIKPTMDRLIVIGHQRLD